MTVCDRLRRAKKDVISVRETIPNTRENRMALDGLLKAEVAINDVLFYSEKEHLEMSC